MLMNLRILAHGRQHAGVADQARGGAGADRLARGGAQRGIDQLALLGIVDLGDAGGRRRRVLAACIQQRLASFCSEPSQPVADLVPGALVLRLFLAPDDFARLRIAAQHALVCLHRERIELLDAHDGDVLSAPSARRAFSRSKYTLPLQNTTRCTCAGSISSISSITVAKPPSVRSSSGDTDSSWRSRLFGVITISGLRKRAQHLPAQHVEHLRRRGGHAHLHVVLGAQLQEALQARRGMLGPLAFVAMRQEQRPGRRTGPTWLRRN